jgi:hypothetical protein
VPEPDTIGWLASIGDVLHNKLAEHELVLPRTNTQAATLATFLDDFISKQTDKKQSTITCLKQCRNDLVEYFGADRPIADITEGDADDFRQHLRTRSARPGRQKSPSARESRRSYRDRDKL